VKFDVAAENEGSCIAMQDFAAVIDTDVDDRPASSTFDTVDSAQSAWTTTGTVAADVWAREQDATGAWLWRGVALPSASDTRLESPDIVVAPAGNFVFTFAHRHDFEADASPAKYWDGGVLELSVDGGQSWADVSTLVAPGYGGALATNSQNPLGGRQAFVGKSANYPQMVPVTLAFGEALAGKTVRFRFRLGTDLAVGAAGWELDDFGVVFAENTPFSALFADSTVCNGVPEAEAGTTRTVEGGALVELDATGSSDPDGDALTFAWTQTQGPAVELFAETTATPVFQAPTDGLPAVLTFEVAVSDGKGASSDTVDVLVEPAQGASGGGGAGGSAEGGGGSGGDAGAGGEGEGRASGGGCDCAIEGGRTGPRGAPGLAALLLAVAALVRRRR
jgi:MYXO-CTERM domain-containing protein